MTRVAAIDCGTNSIRLLIADVHGSVLHDVVRELRIVRLGAGVDRTGRLADDALGRTCVALRHYADQISTHEAVRVRMVATSATRDAANRDDFVAMVRAELGVDPEVVTGSDEAALSFTGAASALPSVDGPLLVCDIGGGSTELVHGRAGDPAGLRAHSMDVGCVRLTERWLHDDPPTAAQVEAVEADVRAALARAAADVTPDGAVSFVGVAGTVTTVAAIALDLPRYDSAALHGATITAGQVEDVCHRLLGMSRAERLALPVLHPGRVDVIVAGAVILRTVVAELGIPAMTASEHDILDGIALGVA